MESLTDKNKIQPDDKGRVPTKAKSEPEIERVKLGKNESIKVAVWLKQLDDYSKGFLQLTKSDLINFLIREHKEELTTKEISQIRANHYDPIRHLNWITPRLKEALSASDTEQIARLQDEIRSIELSVISKITGINNSANVQSDIKQKRLRLKKNPIPLNSSDNDLDSASNKSSTLKSL